ncbi:Cytochrome c oxidase subunit 6b-1 [Linum grandiflorum]
MAEAAAATTNPLSLSEQYLLKDKDDKPAVHAKPVDVKNESVPAPVDSVESVVDKSVEVAQAVEEKAVETAEAVAENTKETAEAVVAKAAEITEAVTVDKTEDAPAVEESDSKDAPPSVEEATEPAQENSGNEEAAEEAPEIKLETAPADYRFPTTNQTRHCFTRYIEYHRCVAAKGEDAQECDKYAKYYRSLCPSEWVERWNEQRENGTFPGPL